MCFIRWDTDVFFDINIAPFFINVYGNGVFKKNPINNKIAREIVFCNIPPGLLNIQLL